MTDAAELTFFVGTYTRREAHVPGGAGAGVVACSLDTASGDVSILGAYGNIVNPSYLHRSADLLYAVSERRDGGELQILDITKPGNMRCVGRQSIAAAACCHVNVRGSEIWIGAYGSGKVIRCLADGGNQISRVDEIGFSGDGPVSGRQEASHVHQVEFSSLTEHAYATDLGADRVYQLQSLSGAIESLAAVPTPPGTGPRHGVFHPALPLFYVLCELEPCILVFLLDERSGRLRHVSTVVFPDPKEGSAGASAAIRIHPSGRMLYASERKGNTVQCFGIDEEGALQPVGVLAAGGKTPRDINVSPCGRWLLVANQDSGRLLSIRLDESSGEATSDARNEVSLNSPVCICF